jgi:hypothetical protein
MLFFDAVESFWVHFACAGFVEVADSHLCGLFSRF